MGAGPSCDDAATALTAASESRASPAVAPEDREYVAKVQAAIEHAIEHVLEERPEDPIRTISARLLTSAHVADQLPQAPVLSSRASFPAPGLNKAGSDPGLRPIRRSSSTPGRDFTWTSSNRLAALGFLGHSSKRANSEMRLPIYAPDEFFDSIDTDRNGILSLHEMVDYLLRKHYTAHEMRLIMSNLEADEDGLITREQWRSGFYSGLPVLLEMKPATSPHLFDALGPPATPVAAGAMKVEERGITLRQLRAVWAHVQARCTVDGWTNVRGELLTLDDVTLYDVVRYVIKPSTHFRGCSYVEFVASSAETQVGVKAVRGSTRQCEAACGRARRHVAACCLPAT